MYFSEKELEVTKGNLKKLSGFFGYRSYTAYPKQLQRNLVIFRCMLNSLQPKSRVCQVTMASLNNMAKFFLSKQVTEAIKEPSNSGLLYDIRTMCKVYMDMGAGYMSLQAGFSSESYFGEVRHKELTIQKGLIALKKVEAELGRATAQGGFYTEPQVQRPLPPAQHECVIL